MEAPEPTCEVGHVAPDWTPAGLAAQSPVEGRCVDVASSGASAAVDLHVCDRRARPGGATPVPSVCPRAPGGVELALGPAGGWVRTRRMDAVLDCQGRYEVRGEHLVLVAEGPGACPPAEPSWAFPTGIALRALAPEREAWVALLPASLRAAMLGDEAGGPETTSATLAWRSGPAPARVGGRDVQLGDGAGWNHLALSVGDAGVSFDAVAVRFRQWGLTEPDGGPVSLATWASGWFDTEGGRLTDVAPVALAESRACGARIAAGTVAGVSGEPEPPGATDCRGVPPGAPEHVTLGPGWITLEWDVVPAANRPPRPPVDPSDWRAEGWDGCTLTCQEG